MDDGRRQHYGGFYGLEDLPRSDRPRVLVHGNCQAEALRVALATADALDTVRVPPVHELEQDDLPSLQRVLDWADVVLAQAVQDDYRGMPLGTAQVVSRSGGARLVALPNYFSRRLFPQQVLVRGEGIGDPPLVPYQDVRRIGRAAGWDGPWEPPHELVVERAAAGQEELRRREREQGSLVISDVVESAGADAGWTVDHPGNPVLVALAQRVLDHLVDADVLDRRDGEVPQVSDPGRTLLASVQTPVSPVVLDALGLDASGARSAWVVDGRTVPDEEVDEAHTAFYAENPKVVEVGMRKYAELLTAWGWRE
ncbi:WcbI family polysaccharide biosynthesis putative acetyltransferase [Ornithinimicrobium sp. W1665]|uniref:WcbI family polysaccharide biosynthesis putative acetyltransferase n=1 Tax=Ornithinimicrobium sp. W1665 TaxID=3416666 RepID=UPI003CED30E3